MKFLSSSRHGQELIIGTVLVLLILGMLYFKRYQNRLYEPGQTACVADCTEVKGNYRRYNHNIFSGDQCICLLDNNISDIWN